MIAEHLAKEIRASGCECGLVEEIALYATRDWSAQKKARWLLALKKAVVRMEDSILHDLMQQMSALEKWD